MNYAPSTVTPLDPEMVQVDDAIGQGAQWRGLLQGTVRPVGIVEILVLSQHDHQVPLVPGQGRSSSSRRQLPIQRSVIEFIRGAWMADRTTLTPAARNTSPDDHGQNVDLAAVEQVGGEEVQRQDFLRLRSQELRPARAVPARRRVDPGALEDLLDRRRRHRDAKSRELTMGPPVSPRLVLP
jgi:hypothetical protein